MTKSNLNKKELAKNYSQKTGFPFSLSKNLIENLLNIFEKHISNGELIIKNIGTFKLIKKKEILWRNPKNKENFIIFKRKIISFSASKKLIKLINE